MKKIICIVLVMVLTLSVMTACNFTTNVSNSAGQMQEMEKLESMLVALSSGDMVAAKALLYPDVASTQSDALEQLQEYLNGRKVTDLNQLNWNVSTSTGLGGKTRQESASFQATLDDGTVFYLSVCYVTENQAQGFSSFQFILGIV